MTMTVHVLRSFRYQGAIKLVGDPDFATSDADGLALMASGLVTWVDAAYAKPDAQGEIVTLTAAQIASPTAAMLADRSATYQLDVAPYTRYQSSGAALVALGGGAGAWGDITGTLADQTDLQGALDAKAAYNAVRSETGTSFTLTFANHANRRTDAANAAAITVTWNTGHSMVAGDCGRIMQEGAGAITVTAGTGTVTLAPGVAVAQTLGIRSWLDWEYMGGDVLRITGRSVVPQKVLPLNAVDNTVTFAPGNTTDATISSIVIPANTIGLNGWVEIMYGVERTAGSGTITLHLRAGSTTGVIVKAVSAVSLAHMNAKVFSQQSLTAMHSTAVNTGLTAESSTIGDVPTGVDSSANITYYLRGQLTVGGDTFVMRYLRAVVHNPDA